MLMHQKELLRLTRSCLVHCLRVHTLEREVPYRGLWGVRPRLGELCSLKRTLDHMSESSMHMCASSLVVPGVLCMLTHQKELLRLTRSSLVHQEWYVC